VIIAQRRLHISTENTLLHVVYSNTAPGSYKIRPSSTIDRSLVLQRIYDHKLWKGFIPRLYFPFVDANPGFGIGEVLASVSNINNKYRKVSKTVRNMIVV